jgi:hypothetical protein
MIPFALLMEQTSWSEENGMCGVLVPQEWQNMGDMEYHNKT